jgi:DNA-binding PadR family transcriptional regulator
MAEKNRAGGGLPRTLELNATAASLLGFLHAGDFTGYELVGVAEAVIGDFWSLTRSQVYRELAELARHGLVEAGEPGTRSRRPYRLTRKGRAAFRRWITQVPGPDHIRSPLLLTVSFGALVGSEALLTYVAAHRAVHEKRLADYVALVDEEPDPYRRATLTFGIRYERGVLAWMDELPNLLPRSDPARGPRKALG